MTLNSDLEPVLAEINAKLDALTAKHAEFEDAVAYMAEEVSSRFSGLDADLDDFADDIVLIKQTIAYHASRLDKLESKSE